MNLKKSLMIMEVFPYEGMALYKITLDEDAAEEFAKWESLPFSKKVGDFLTSCVYLY